jgi:hypothetical protein
MDLVGRKLPMRGGAVVKELLAQLRDGASAELADAVDAVGEATDWLLANGFTNPNDAMAGSVPYLRMWGIALGGWLLARSAAAAAGNPPGIAQTVLDSKGHVERFYAHHVLPQVRGLLPAVTAGSDLLYAVTNP